MTNFVIPVVFILLCQVFTSIFCANILALLPSISPSHLVFQMTAVKGLAERNHNVTVVSLLPLKSEWLHQNIKHIKLEMGPIDMGIAMNSMQVQGLRRLKNHYVMLSSVTVYMSQLLEQPEIQDLIKNPGNHFDLMLYGYIWIDFYFGLAEHFNCPAALLWPNIAVTCTLNLIGSPLEMSYTVSTFLKTISQGKGFVWRLKNMFAIAEETLIYWTQYSFSRKVYEKHFPSDKYASFEKAKERVSMVLYSHHFSEKPVRPLVPALIEIGGIHLKEEPNPLPKDIEDFVNSAEHGFIFFSLGTNIKADHLHDGFLVKIYNVLSKLPQKVLWKCDDELNVIGNATNILFRNWMPQADILGHPNVKLFFGHGGKGGITEAKFYGVPMVGLPLFGDQTMNMEEVVRKGYGLSINYEEHITEKTIYETVMEVLNNETYANNVKTFSKIYRDRPMKPMDTAMYWLEYLIRYRGAPHLQSPLKTMSLIEKTNLDVIVFLISIILLTIVAIKYFFMFMVKFLFRHLRFKLKND